MILTLEQADGWVAEQRKAGKKIGFTCGAFDICHAGHVQYLQSARERCDALIVAVNSDQSIRRYKSALRPIVPEQQRMFVIAGLRAVDAVVLMTDSRPLKLLLRWKPDLYIKGGDYTAGSLKSGKAVEEYGGSVWIIRPEYSISTSVILENIRTISTHAVPEQVQQQYRDGLILLDRDGTLIRDVPFLNDPEQVEMLPGVLEGLARLTAAGYRLMIVSNQQGIGLGYSTTQGMIAVNQRMLKAIGAAGGKISRIYYCPHSVADYCQCRKPAPGMILRALTEFDAKAEESWVIGDHDADEEAGRAAGCKTLRVSEGGFSAAVARILGQ